MDNNSTETEREFLAEQQKQQYNLEMEEKFGKELWDRVEQAYYVPSDSYEWYDPKNHDYYNNSGQRLRHPSEYDTSDPEWTPFGDE